MGVLETFEDLAKDPRFRERVTGVLHLPARAAEFRSLDCALHPLLIESLGSLGVGQLYTHQVESIRASLDGRDVMVVTGTGSGKSLCYNVPVVQRFLTEPVATALYVFPTKALAQDQAKNLPELAPSASMRVGIFDGDTPKNQRSLIKRTAAVVVTNPDMLHVGILPQHETWSRFFRSLRTIVIDEAHAYTGVFGSHVAHVVRRLLRVCEFYRSSPTVIACSATIAEPDRHFALLTGREAVVVDNDGAPKSDRYLAFIDAPSPEASDGFSPNKDAAVLLARLCSSGQRVLAFCRSRSATEVVMRTAQKELSRAGETGVRLDSYRGGYTPKERRQIERYLFSGKLSGLATTNAMELGVDVGGLDAVVMNGYPGKPSSYWQQAGRAGRGKRPGLAVMLAHEDPLEQFIARDPRRIVEGGVERTSLDPQNPQVLAAQLACAAYERPLSPEELPTFGAGAHGAASGLVDSGQLTEGAGRFFLPRHTSPAGSVNIRGTGSDGVTLVCDDEEVGEMERWRAFQYAHRGAVYLHRQRTFVVQSLDVESGVAVLEEADPDYFTQPVVQSVVQPTVSLQKEGEFELCGVRVTTSVRAFRRMALDGKHMLGEEPLDLPPQKFETVGVRVSYGHDFGEDSVKLVRSTHGLEHALMAMAPFVASCDRRDLGSAWFPLDPKDMEPSVYVYDAVPGGIGLCETLFGQRDEWSRLAWQLLVDCRCADGCPACLLSSSCESANDNLDKEATARILHSLTRARADR